MNLLSYKVKRLDQAPEIGLTKSVFYSSFPAQLTAKSFRLIGSSKLAVGATHAKPVG
jgi:hypothetical protein